MLSHWKITRIVMEWNISIFNIKYKIQDRYHAVLSCILCYHSHNAIINIVLYRKSHGYSMHMRRFPEPQHFFAAEWQNWDFAIAIIFYPAIRTLWKFLCILFGCCSTQILNFNANNNFANMLKIVRKLDQTLIFEQFLTLQNCFLYQNSKSEC